MAEIEPARILLSPNTAFGLRRHGQKQDCPNDVMAKVELEPGIKAYGLFLADHSLYRHLQQQ